MQRNTAEDLKEFLKRGGRWSNRNFITFKSEKEDFYLKIKEFFFNFLVLVKERECYILNCIFLINGLIISVYFFYGTSMIYFSLSLLSLFCEMIGLILLCGETKLFKQLWYILTLLNSLFKFIFILNFIFRVLVSQKNLTDFLGENYLKNILALKENELNLLGFYIFTFYLQLLFTILNFLAWLSMFIHRNFFTTFIS